MSDLDKTDAAPEEPEDGAPGEGTEATAVDEPESDLEATLADDAGDDSEPTVVDEPVAEDETSPEGIPTDEEVTGLEPVADDGVADEDEEASDEEASVAGEPDVEPPLRLLHEPPPQLGWRLARFAAVFALAGTAVGVHMWMNVPEEPVISKTRDQGSKKKRGRRPRPKKKLPARSAAELDQAWERWGTMPFEEEPMRGRWPRDMQTMVNKAVVVARKAAFEGAPEDPQVIVTGTQCRTVRCRFVLRSPFEHEIQLLAQTLRRTTYDSEPMWRSVETESIDPPTEQSPKDDHYLQVVVAVAVDGYEASAIEVGPPVPPE